MKVETNILYICVYIYFGCALNIIAHITDIEKLDNRHAPRMRKTGTDVVISNIRH